MNIATDIDWDIDNDKVCISFKNTEINNCLKEYAVDYKKDNILIEKTETNYESTLSSNSHTSADFGSLLTQIQKCSTIVSDCTAFFEYRWLFHFLL